MNNGKVYTDCPYITINKDKNFDYLLSTNSSGLRTLIAAGDTTTATIVKKLTSWCGRTNPVSPTVVEKNIRVIWYLAKSMENGWHVDGLLTDKDDIKAACDACKDEGFQELPSARTMVRYSSPISSLPTIIQPSTTSNLSTRPSWLISISRSTLHGAR